MSSGSKSRGAEAALGPFVVVAEGVAAVPGVPLASQNPEVRSRCPPPAYVSSESFGVSSSSLSDVFSGPYGICSAAQESPPEGEKELELGGPNHFKKKKKNHFQVCLSPALAFCLIFGLCKSAFHPCE